jgi:hypothetical protein
MVSRIAIIFILLVIAVTAIMTVVLLFTKWFTIEQNQVKTWITLSIEMMTLVTLIITAIFVVLYWGETKDMKDEMVTQSKLNETVLKEMKRQSEITLQNNKLSLMPIFELELKKATDPNGFNEVILHNKGRGPAKVFFCRITIDPSILPQRRVVLDPQRRIQPRGTAPRVGVLGSGKHKTIFRDQNPSYEFMKVEIGFQDLFGGRPDQPQWVFQGNPQGFDLMRFPTLDDFREEAANEVERK